MWLRVPANQKRPSWQKKRPVQTVRKRQNRGRIYLATIVIIIVVTAVGLYIYSLGLSGPPDFVIAAHTAITVHAGSPTTETVNITAVNHFDSTIQLSVNSTSGIIAAISPANVTGSGTAKLTLSAANNGTYSVTVTGTSGSLKHFVTPVVATPVYATLETSNGTILVELYLAQAPGTVTNFVSLAQSGFYTNLTWHRIIKGFVIQTGDPTTKNGGGDRSTWGQTGSSQTVPLEIDPTLHNNVGYLGMARSSEPNSGSSQFYINLANNNSLDGNYTVFGKVINSSMSAAYALGNTPTYSSAPYKDEPINPVFLISVTISQ